MRLHLIPLSRNHTVVLEAFHGRNGIRYGWNKHLLFRPPAPGECFLGEGSPRFFYHQLFDIAAITIIAVESPATKRNYTYTESFDGY